MNFRTSHATESHGMNLVPLIDVLLILLVFFIVTFSMAQRENDLNISVPAAESGAPKDRQVGEIVVNIGRDGSVRVNTQQLTEEQLFKRFQDIYQLNKKQAIIIRADEESVYKNMFKVLDLCYKAGLYHVSFAALPASVPAAAP
ncbi:MAG: biopolymer transporter ExbD [Verrucomicrobiaceae bacterium]|nr:MAG: biopolymer transporter ExbD [Verrucomicrobiaceae bacterium]